jgi:hypothetical protein
VHLYLNLPHARLKHVNTIIASYVAIRRIPSLSLTRAALLAQLETSCNVHCRAGLGCIILPLDFVFSCAEIVLFFFSSEKKRKIIFQHWKLRARQFFEEEKKNSQWSGSLNGTKAEIWQPVSWVNVTKFEGKASLAINSCQFKI